jgi:hypothetical protein
VHTENRDDPLVDDLDVLADRAWLIFSHDFEVPNRASKMVTALRERDLASFNDASCKFVDCASNEIRGRHWWEGEREPGVEPDPTSSRSAAA